MKSNEQEIRDLFDNWIKATTEGNLELAHRCIADDALFFVPGAGEMDKISFAQAAAGVSPEESPIEFDLKSEIRELKVFGDYKLGREERAQTPGGFPWASRTLSLVVATLRYPDGVRSVAESADNGAPALGECVARFLLRLIDADPAVARSRIQSFEGFAPDGDRELRGPEPAVDARE